MSVESQIKKLDARKSRVERWEEHVIRMSRCRVPRRAVTNTTRRRIAVGRPRKQAACLIPEVKKKKKNL